MEGDLALKKNHQYYTQVQLQMFVCSASYADFVIWTLQIVIVHRVTQDISLVYMKGILLHANDNTENNVLPNKENQTQPSDVKVTMYCVCQTTEDEGEMVACDKSNQ